MALYTDNMSITAMSCQPVLFVKYQETYLSNLQGWLRGWRFTINVLKSTVMLFTKAGRHIPTSSVFRQPIHCVNTTCSLSMILDKRLNWSTHIERVKKNATQ